MPDPARPLPPAGFTPANQWPPTASTWAVLAAMRWVLASIVLAGHLRGIFVPVSAVVNGFHALGADAAVIGFFLISGYSIAHSYGERPQKYYRRRFLRIYPLFSAAVVFTQAIVLIVPSPAVCLAGHAFVAAGYKTTVANLLMLQEFLAIPVPYDGPLWTLSIEVFYYVLAPLLHRLPTLIIGLLAVASMIVFETWRGQIWLGGYNAAVYGWPWLIGFLLGRARSGLAWPVALGLAGTVLVLGHATAETGSLGGVTYVATFGLILAGPHLRLSPLARQAANLLGNLSYPLYLFHLPLAILFFKHFGMRSLPGLAACIIGSTALIWYAVDEKFKRWFWIPLVKRAADIASGRLAVP